MEQVKEERDFTLPNAKVGQVIELINKLAVLGNKTDREGLAYALSIEKNSISHPLKASEILRFVTTKDAIIELTEDGVKFANAKENHKREMFKNQLLVIEPFATLFRALGQGEDLTPSNVLDLIKAKIVSARRWKASTDREMIRVITNWLEYAGVRTLSQTERTKRDDIQ